MRQQIIGTIIGLRGEHYGVLAEYDDFDGETHENPSHLYIMEGNRVLTSTWYHGTAVNPSADPFILAAVAIATSKIMGTSVRYDDFIAPGPEDDFDVIELLIIP